MISKSQISLVKSLHQKKYRKEHQLFIVEGFKAISEFLNSNFVLSCIYCTSDFSAKVTDFPSNLKVYEVTINDLEKISALQTPQGILAIVETPKNTLINTSVVDEMVIVLDGVQDPGNLGTIIRTADWFGFKEIVCSLDCVDVYNPKVVQATMGSLTRVKVYYQDLKALLQTTELPIYGALLKGKNIYNTQWQQKGFFVLGNEGNGISEDIIELITQPITIPGGKNTESLNVAIAGAICCSEISRNKLK